MPTALAVRHVHFEDLGAFAAPLAEAGYTIRYLDAGLDDPAPEALAAADLLIVLGGPIGANETDLYPFLTAEIEGLRRRLAAGRPTLGLCLGAQLMARALGAQVAAGAAKEIGWAPVDLTEAGRAGPLGHLDGTAVLHWHGDAFEVPAGGVRLASTPATPNQAFSVGRHALALQFHPEADGRGFERWLVGHAVEIAAVSGLSVAGLRADAARLGPAAAAAGRRCLADWLAGLAD